MSMDDKAEGRRLAVALLNRLIAESESQDWQDADEFVVLSTDDETKAITLYGGFEDPVEALVWAEQHDTNLNRGAPPDEIPFVSTVYPMRKPQ